MYDDLRQIWHARSAQLLYLVMASEEIKGLGITDLFCSYARQHQMEAFLTQV